MVRAMKRAAVDGGGKLVSAATPEEAFHTSVQADIVEMKGQLMALAKQVTALTGQVTALTTTTQAVNAAVGNLGELSAAVTVIKDIVTPLAVIPGELDNIKFGASEVEGLRDLIGNVDTTAKAVQGATTAIQGQTTTIVGGIANVKNNLKVLFEFFNDKDE